jgi:hypothetical protein
MPSASFCRLFALGVSACWLPACRVQAKTYKLYYLGGQSNMDGYGYVTKLPAELQGPIAGVMIFHGNTAPDGAAT